MSDNKNIDISGLDKASVLSALYNASTPYGTGFKPDHDVMTVEEAQEIIGQRGLNFDYVGFNHPLKVDLEGDNLDAEQFDRNNGYGKAEGAIVELRNS
ncbi:MAG: hypothetical protein KDJ35_00960 [Alphaproteobacteria bacterium]|nr:hypothetical protein [Alphaproteobacteria bacterium]